MSSSCASPHATPQVLSLKRNHGGLHFASLNAGQLESSNLRKKLERIEIEKKKHVKSQESKLTRSIWGKKATNASNNAWVNQSSANLVL